MGVQVIGIIGAGGIFTLAGARCSEDTKRKDLALKIQYKERIGSLPKKVVVVTILIKSDWLRVRVSFLAERNGEDLQLRRGGSA